jgi:hypothetical protein
MIEAYQYPYKKQILFYFDIRLSQFFTDKNKKAYKNGYF